MEAVIEVEGLVKRYGDFEAVKGINFTVRKGEIVGFLGPNGAGKSTTMRILTGYLPLTAGRVKIAGRDIEAEPMEAKRKIGYMPEVPPLYTDMTVGDYLLFVARIKGVESKQRRTRVAKVMEQCAITDVQGRVIAKLSKGYRQRVGLAQALVNNPELLILDEPTAGLDPTQIIEIRKLIKSLAGEHTIILSTHILPEVTMTCDRAVIINRGKIVADDTISNLSKGKSLEEVFISLTMQPEAA
jgi:ABC-2 type transport system ATP-binding protein